MVSWRREIPSQRQECRRTTRFRFVPLAPLLLGKSTICVLRTSESVGQPNSGPRVDSRGRESSPNAEGAQRGIDLGRADPPARVEQSMLEVCRSLRIETCRH